MKYNDKFYPTPITILLKTILKQLNQGHVLGLPKELFFTPEPDDFFKTQFFGIPIDSPIGVAAGPHTQLAQNIVVAWLAGARFIELKTIQTLDELDISKPCIDMQEEGYNCEWSQELKIFQAFDQYLNAWILIHILAHELGLKDHGAIFNMSVGYNMEGILKPNVQWFLDKMTDCSEELEQKINQIRPIYPDIDKISIPSQISNNVTLSTMHGCPPDEVEQIASYLLSERNLHTIIKLNPTLLGKEQVREILANAGYKTTVPDIAFEHDLKFEQAVKIVEKLQKLAEQKKLFFTIKLTNTLESLNHKGIFDDEYMYMSGKALHPISINLAAKFQNYFSGKLKISFSGGVDAFNIKNVLSCGLAPVTVSSDLLKPGGYGRLAQYYESLRQAQKELNLKSIDDLINKSSFAPNASSTELNAWNNLKEYAQLVKLSPYYQKYGFVYPDIKAKNKPLHDFDCIFAPCQNQCPTNQNVPQYMYLVSQGKLKEAFWTLLQDNPFPSVLGYTCDQTCRLKCTRINYDEALMIREIKRFIADYNADTPFTLPVEKVKNTGKVAVIGGGPGGLSAAYYLKLYGFDVDIFEASDSLGGMVAKAIPLFRLPENIIRRDIQRILDLGINVKYNQKLYFEQIEQLQSQYSAVIVAVGAMKTIKLNIPGIDANGVIDPFDFLFKTRKQPYSVKIGPNVAVIGGGNTAIDIARIAKRLSPNGSVYILYRRAKEHMPADYEEILEAELENVQIIEKVIPLEIIKSPDGKVSAIKLQKVELVQSETDSRPVPKPIPNTEFTLKVDTIIPAIGQKVDPAVVPQGIVKPDKIPTSEHPGLYVIGDAARGGYSIVAAINDGKQAALKIIRSLNPGFKPFTYKINKNLDYKNLKLRRFKRIPPEDIPEIPAYERNNFDTVIKTLIPETAKLEASRCLLCDELCDICTTVCPNLANQHYETEIKQYKVYQINISDQISAQVTNPLSITQKYQTLNIGDWCNECGNCATFCPSSGKPYVDKPKLHLSWQSYMDSPFGYLVSEDQNNATVFYKNYGQEHKLQILDDSFIYKFHNIEIIFDKDFNILNINTIDSDQRPNNSFTTEQAIKMFIIYQAYKQIF